MKTVHPIAVRAKFHEARRAFAEGATVLITESDEGPTRWVYPNTTTHNRDTTTWDYLATSVREWRSRYPGQRFYIVVDEQEDLTN